MAGPAQRGSRERGETSRRASSARSAGAMATVRRGSADSAGTRAATASTYRGLVTRGLAPEEAATLTAFMCGIPIEATRWSLRQVNELLFLRAMAQAGRFGSSDGDATRLH